MKYQAYQAHADMLEQMRSFTQAAGAVLAHPWWNGYPGARKLAAAYEVFSIAKVTHSRPPFGIASVTVGDPSHERSAAVTEEFVHTAPFGSLLRFRKEGITDHPKVLLVAPMSGHFATLLRETARTMLADHDVYITDWHNAREVPLTEGRFGLDEYVAYLIKFLEIMGPGSHVVAICQPCVPALVAAAVMAEDRNHCQPASLTLMAGPIDCRINPSKVNELATSKPIAWFEKNLISTVPTRYPGARRRVYPGFLQLTAFMSMNPDRHMNAFKELYHSLVRGERDKAEVTRNFYEEYFAVLDMTEEFYIETVRHIFQDFTLPLGKLEWRGRVVKPAAIRRTALLTVEGERDDICSIGQTMAAQDLCSSIPAFMKSHHMQTGVGHYGVFSGRRWNQQIYPIVRDMIHASKRGEK